MRDIRIVERDGKLWFECDDSYYDCEVRGEDVALVLSHSWGVTHRPAPGLRQRSCPATGCVCARSWLWRIAPDGWRR